MAKNTNEKPKSATSKSAGGSKKGSVKKKTKAAVASVKSAISGKMLGGILWAKMAIGGLASLRRNADEVNKLNVFPVPDGDTGDNMRMTIESGIRAIERLDSDNLAEVMRALSHGMLLGARGNSGVILSQFFAGIAKGLESSDEADPETFGHALEIGVEKAYASVMTPTEGTILTVAREAVEYAVSRITPASTIRTLFADLVSEMRASLERTPETLAVLKEAGVVDSGGAGLLYIMDGFNRVLNGDEIPDDEMPAADTAAKAPVTLGEGFGPDSKMTYGYCTELLLQLQRAKGDVDAFDVEELKSFLSTLGDSIVAFKTDSIVKLHVHTFTPERVLEYGRRFGEFISVKIENMSVQHTELAVEEEKPAAKEEPAPAAVDAPKKKYGVVAVTNGPGVEALYLELGCDAIVQGGQTQNPSTNDFIEAFGKINAEHIFVFPNNGNIFMAAQQAAEIYEAATVHVIPTKSVGTGYVALSSANFEHEEAEQVIADMNEAIARVTAGYISPAIRDTEIGGVAIKNGDTIGVIEKEIVLSLPERADAARELATRLLSLPEKFMLTVFCGADATEEERGALEAAIGEAHPDAEVYFIDGGQEIYPYIFVAE